MTFNNWDEGLKAPCDGCNNIVNGLAAILDSENLMEVNKWHYTFGLMQKLKSTLEPADFSCAEFWRRIYVEITAYCYCSFGVESVVGRELKKLGYKDQFIENGRSDFLQVILKLYAEQIYG